MGVKTMKAKRNPLWERRMLYAQGFGDGAKGSALKHEGREDYMRGWRDGCAAKGRAIREFCGETGAPLPSPLRSS